METKLSFEVQESPVLYSVDGKVLTSNSHKVLSRSDNNRVLSVMKNSYFPMYNQHFMETTQQMKEISGFSFEGYSELDGGKIILSHLKNDLEDIKINGNKINDYLVLGSSFDGRYSFFIGTSTVFLRCKNQFSKLSQAEKVRHTKSAPKKRDELLKSLEVYFSNRRNMYQNFDKMQNIKLDAVTRQLAIDYVLNISREDRLEGKISTRKMNQMEMLDLAIDTEINDLGQNIFGLFNGFTRFSTFDVKQKERSFGSLFGVASEINSRAYNFALELI